VDLTTEYLGFTLPHPLIPGAGPFADDLDLVRRLEDAGAPMIAMRSLFEEQLTLEQLALARALDGSAGASAEAPAGWFPDATDFVFGPEEYLEQLGRVKAAVQVPVVASLNGTSERGWLDFARRIEQAGADALELNLYEVVTDPDRPAAAIEARDVALVREIRRQVKLPLAVKLSPFFTSLPNFAAALARAGADALVLFNRFHQPDLDAESLEIRPELRLSTAVELPLRLRWTAILCGRVDADLAITGGVHGPYDAVKALLAGADAVQIVSALLLHGPGYLAKLRDGIAQWFEEHEFESLAPSIGALSHRRCPDPALLERAHYARLLQTWRPR
jgi:dihydroorotate dehydrogenase (fumarate)